MKICFAKFCALASLSLAATVWGAGFFMHYSSQLARATPVRTDLIKEEMAWKIMAQLPEVLTNATQNIDVTDELGKPCPLCAPSEGVVATAYGERISIWRGGLWLDPAFVQEEPGYQFARKVVSHEAAHNFAKQKWGQFDPPKDSEYGQAARMDGKFYTEYSRTNASEDFAEAVSEYCTVPRRVKESSPNRFIAIWNLIGKCWE